MISFFKEYIKNPFKVGAIAPSTKSLAKEMVKDIDFSNTNYIVEYGAGTGVFTKEIVERSTTKTKILVFENNKKFYKDLENKYKRNSNVIIINDGAENVLYHLKKNKISKVDFVISGLPFTSFPESVSQLIIENTKKALSDKGEFRTFQYSLLKKSLFEQSFSNITHTKIYKNLPPAYVLRCKTEERKGISA